MPDGRAFFRQGMYSYRPSVRHCDFEYLCRLVNPSPRSLPWVQLILFPSPYPTVVFQETGGIWECGTHCTKLRSRCVNSDGRHLTYTNASEMNTKTTTEIRTFGIQDAGELGISGSINFVNHPSVINRHSLFFARTQSTSLTSVIPTRYATPPLHSTAKRINFPGSHAATTMKSWCTIS